MNSDELLRENQALRERLSLLSEASLGITENLEPNAVLQGVVDGARSLTGAGTAGITALDERGQLWEFVTSGLTPFASLLALPTVLVCLAVAEPLPARRQRVHIGHVVAALLGTLAMLTWLPHRLLGW